VRLRPAAVVIVAALVAVVVSHALSGCSSEGADGTPPPPTTLPPPAVSNVAYGERTECDPAVEGACSSTQTMDIWQGSGPGPHPVLVWVHGGGGISGDKTLEVPEQLQPVLDAGWDVVSVNYQLASRDGDQSFPAGLLDVKRAVRWIKANATANNWDANRVGIAGFSMGGNLAEMVAVTADEGDLEPVDLPPDLAAVDSRVLFAISISAVSDLQAFEDGGGMGAAAAMYAGCVDGGCADAFAAGSVAGHVDPESAPILAIHGDRDPWGTVASGQTVADAYVAAGIGPRFALVIINSGDDDARGHAPDLNRVSDTITSFITAR
jgi:acetyl esterase/lipase